MFLHTYHPNPILLNLGPVKIYWYGFFIVLGILVAFIISDLVLKAYQKKQNGSWLNKIDLADLGIYILFGGLVGARLLHVISEWEFYLKNPMDILKVWNGGLWIFGAIIGGSLGVLIYARINFEKNECGKITKFTLDLIAPGLVLAQAIGRWGNYFNQELYGLPTKLPWGIPISIVHKVTDFTEYSYFHPVFLYESFFCLIVFLILIKLHAMRLKNENSRGFDCIFLVYLFLYSLGRFGLEFLRIDTVSMLFGLRITQITALLAILSTPVIDRILKMSYS